MEKKIYRSLCVIGVAVALVCTLLIFAVMQVSATAQLRQSVRDSAYALADVWNATAVQTGAIDTANAGTLRVTLLDADGTVHYDSAGATENHADRPEFNAARQFGFGESTRLSSTLQTQTYYYAVRLADGGVLRASAATRSLYARMLSGVPFLILGAGLVSILAALAASALTKKLLRPVNAVDIEHPLRNETYDELVPLLRRIDRQNRELNAQVDTVAAMRDDLADIMQNMSEGLIVLSASGTVLSANRSALALFGTEEAACLGSPLLTLCRDDCFLRLSDALRRHTAFHESWEHGGRIYRLSLSTAARGGSLLMLVDETEKCAAEQLRREFSANVSHELKTPLQSLSGYAELLCGGVVQEADKPRFYENIYREAQRLIALVQDIIRLSQLDEGAPGVSHASRAPDETADLLALAQQTAELLGAKADGAGVRVTVQGAPAMVRGGAASLSELIYNLVDNAISYNRPDGTVTVAVEQTPNACILRVKDTGIGIPPEHQSRVFERFYRVDKSHSRATGGTGLGLSIVKHIVQRCGGEITLQSTPGIGTEIKVVFPPAAEPATERDKS